jgi:hypothetical protein
MGKRCLQLLEAPCVVWGGNTRGCTRVHLDYQESKTAPPCRNERVQTRHDFESRSGVQAAGHGELALRFVVLGGLGEPEQLLAGPE